MLKFSCPQCGCHYEIDDEFLGKKVRCTKCNAKFYLSEPEENGKPSEAATQMNPPDSSPYLDQTIPGKRAMMQTDNSGESDLDKTVANFRERKIRGNFQPGDTVLGRYRLTETLGSGAMGIVYKCVDSVSNEIYAIKMVPPELARDEEAMASIRENFRLIHNLKHPNIAGVDFLDCDEYGSYFLIMEFAPGISFAKWLRQKRESGNVDFSECMDILQQIASALDFAHEQKILHRDIKPANIMIGDDGKVKVLDFGLASKVRSSLTNLSINPANSSGTPNYMAPEQFKAQYPRAQSDQYALAVVAYEMFAGHLPFEADNFEMLRSAVINDEPEKISPLPVHIQNALGKAMSKDPANRFENCSQFIEALLENKKTGIAPLFSKLDALKKNKKYKLVGVVLGVLILAIIFESSFRGASEDHSTKNAVSTQTKKEQQRVISKSSAPPQKNNRPPMVQTRRVQPRKINQPLIIKRSSDEHKKLKDLDLKKIAADEAQGFKFDKVKRTLVKAPEYLEDHYKIPDGITSIEYHAFSDCSNLQSITIPDGVTNIGSHAFKNCSNLQSITIPDGVTTIGSYAFQGCKNLRQIRLPNNIKVISYCIFDGCSNLRSITITNSVKTIGGGAFRDCSNLRSITIPHSVETIGGWAFAGCSNLRSVTIPNSVVKIGDRAFQGCKNLRQIRLPNNIKIISEGTFFGCTSLRINIPASVRMIRNNAFKGVLSVTSDNDTFIVDDQGRLIDKKRNNILYTPPAGRYGKFNGMIKWRAVMGYNPSHFKKGDNFPVEQISRYDAKEFCNKLNKLYAGRLPQGYLFNLPTEVQWEYACRAGTTTALNNGKNLTDLKYNCGNLSEIAL